MNRILLPTGKRIRMYSPTGNLCGSIISKKPCVYEWFELNNGLTKLLSLPAMQPEEYKSLGRVKDLYYCYECREVVTYTFEGFNTYEIKWLLFEKEHTKEI